MTPAEALRSLYAARNALRGHFPGLPFTLDGKLVGDIGEAIAGRNFGFTRLRSGNKKHDVVTDRGVQVQIKTTQTRRHGTVGLGIDEQEFDHLVVIQISEDASFEVLYDGRGRHVSANQRRKHARSQITVKQLRDLDAKIPRAERLVPRAKRKGTL